MELFAAEEARDAVLKHGAAVVPGVKVLQQAVFGKVFSGKMPDGSIWKITKEGDDTFSVSVETMS